VELLPASDEWFARLDARRRGFTARSATNSLSQREFCADAFLARDRRQSATPLRGQRRATNHHQEIPVKRPIAILPFLFIAATAAASDYSFDLPFQGPRAVYVETNAAEKNEILVYRRDRDGGLQLADRVNTRGLGTGAGLGNQGALALSNDGRRLYAVNAGSNDISAFAIVGSRLLLTQKISSGGEMPISLALHGDLLYVVNEGSSSSTGFYTGDDRRLHVIPGSTRPLSGAAVDPAQISFNVLGDVLAVTEKGSSKIVVYDVVDGVAQAPKVRDSRGMTPFGFAFDRHDNLIVSEAFGGVPNASAVSSYELDGAEYPLEAVSASLRNGQTAACWVVVTRNGRYAYVANTGSSSITGLRIARNGGLSLLDKNGVTATTGSGSSPIDVATSNDGRYLFALAANVGTISSYRIREDGSLKATVRIDGVPLSASGLVVR
jgi:6-phosphogluconolactonase